MGERDRFLWQWAHHLFPKFTLSSVSTEYDTRLQDGKLLALVYITLLDDLAERRADRVTFEEAAKIPFDHLKPRYDRSGVDREVLDFAEEVWARFVPTVRGGPRSEEFEHIFRFDLHQVRNAVDYSFVVNDNLDFMTSEELTSFDAHNMMIYVFADLDLIHSPTFDRRELSTLRQVLNRAQRMTRIGNWISTWERELREGDYSSGVVALALENGIIDLDELRHEPNPDVASIIEWIHTHSVEEAFVSEWQEQLIAGKELAEDIESIDIDSYLDGIETIMDYHLATRGIK